MIEKTKKYELAQGDGSILHKTVYECQECPKEGETSEYIRMALLAQLGTHKDLLKCPYEMFDSLKLEHVQGRWTLTLLRLEKKEG